jgi:hypothetical protein
MVGESCLHVKISAKRREIDTYLMKTGYMATDDLLDLLMSGKAFPVSRRERANGQGQILIENDEGVKFSLWFPEQYTMEVEL